jgi:type IV fimbrial biogenesis protein FimT
VLNAFPKRKSFGFSLVELMVGIVIVGILVTLAMPSFQDMLRNAEIRNAAESITNGLQRARAEAVARNAKIEFVLGAGTDSSWTVNYSDTPGNPPPVTPPIDSRSSNEGSKDVTRTVLPADATTVTFNSLGGVVTDVASLAQVDLAAVGGSQNLRVTIGVGGNARMCDPSLASGSSPRAC